MDIGSIFLILALLILVGLFVSRPFLEHQRFVFNLAQKPLEHEQSHLLAERDRILNALQELDFDYTLGKIPQEDYPVQRQALLQRGSDVLRRLEALLPAADTGEDAEARLEATIAARRIDAGCLADPKVGFKNGSVSSTIAAPDDDLEVLLSNRRRVRQEKAGGFCPKCGRAVQKSDHFCPKCGSKVI